MDTQRVAGGTNYPGCPGIGISSDRYRHMYGNEDIVGEAVAESRIPRDEIFIATKLCGTRAGYKLARQGIEESLERLQTDYIDLLLIHEPYAEAGDMYRALTEAYLSGQVRAIGISNFNAREYLTFIETCGIIPDRKSVV